MTIQKLQDVVLKLSNQMFVRHYVWLNYPNDPQVMGIQFQSALRQRTKTRRRLTCECGDCYKCKHREAMRLKYRTKQLGGSAMLLQELESLGFTWREDLKLWAVERTEGDGEKHG